MDRTTQEFENAAAINWNSQEFVNDVLYDWQTYAAAGQVKLSFLKTPVGQGTSIFDATQTKTFEDTNLEGTAGMMSRGEAFLCKALGIDFVPGFTPVLDTVTVAAPVARVKYRANDAATFYEQGWLEFRVLNKIHSRVGPLRVFPPFTEAEIDASFTSFWTLAAAATDYEAVESSMYKIVGPKFTLAGDGVRLDYSMRFDCTLNWSKAVALPSAVAGRVQWQLMGKRMRVGQ